MPDEDYLEEMNELEHPEKRAWNSGFQGALGKRAWNSGFQGALGKRAWNSGIILAHNSKEKQADLISFSFQTFGSW